jgi:hypothetical protein
VTLLEVLDRHPLAVCTGLALLPALPAVYAFLSDLASRIVGFLLSMIFVGRELNDEFTRLVILGYLTRHAKSAGIADQFYDVSSEPIRSLGGLYRSVVRRINSRSWRLYLYRGAPIVLVPRIPGEEDTRNATLRHLRWTVDWEALVKEAAREFDASKDDGQGTRKFYVATHVGSSGDQRDAELAPFASGVNSPSPGPSFASASVLNFDADDIGMPIPENPVDAVSVTPEMRRVIEEATFWKDHRNWYQGRGIPWTHGFLLHGKPGTGKTSTVRTVGQLLDIPVHVFRLATMSDRDFTNSWRFAKREGGARIVLFEDLDSVFHGRENVTGHDFSFDALLNAIQGVEAEDGLLLFVTTNHIEHIDPALGRLEADGSSTRPGRIDSLVEMGLMGVDDRLKIARRILQDEDEAQKIVTANLEETPAQLTDRCKRLARDVLWGRA